MKRRFSHGMLLAGLALGVFGLVFHAGRSEKPVAPNSEGAPAVTSPAEVASAIGGLELVRAERLLAQLPASAAYVPALRARTALYRGDCDEARALLSSVSATQGQEARELSQLAENCARAVAGAKTFTDDSRGVWLRVQDDADAVLVNLIAEVAARARDTTGVKLGVSLPRPLRIELVMDHASLSALTGLPLDAAETTGTVAVARWGRVTMLSPRSFAEGYPWQDTLAHEITHLLVTTATRDNAPLWLQEALAKRFEIAWRPSRPLDGVPNQHFVTWTAWQQGRAIGVENLGASIALLPSPESARIAYAEVTDFLDFILRDSGWPALRLLLRELRDLGAERFNTALASVTGYTQEDWIRRWRAALSSEHETKKIANDSASGVPTEQAIDVARKMRLAELLASRNAWAAVDRTCSEDHVFEANQPDFHARAGLAKLQRGEPEQALELIGTGEQLVSLQGDWLALRGRALSELGRVPEAELHFNLALAFAPTDERVCCEGRSQFDTLAGGPSTVPTNPVRRPLCLAARGLAASAGHPPID